MSHPGLATVASIDLPRYLGTWHEIARLPMRHEPADFRDITAEYSLQEDGKLRVVNRATNGKGKPEESVGEASALDAGNSRLEVTFLPEGLRWIPFTKGDYWIIKIDPAYTTALVGSPDRKYLWLLARQPQLDPTTKEEFLDYARAQGFDLGELIHTPQGHRSAA